MDGVGEVSVKSFFAVKLKVMELWSCGSKIELDVIYLQ